MPILWDFRGDALCSQPHKTATFPWLLWSAATSRVLVCWHLGCLEFNTEAALNIVSLCAAQASTLLML